MLLLNVLIKEWSFFGYLLCLIVSAHAVFGDTSSDCGQDGRSLSYLEVAVDMITKAKTYFPVCPSHPSAIRPVDCEEVSRGSSSKKSGVYAVWPRNRVRGDAPLNVYCDMDTEGGGWLVLQRRGNFNRPNDYFYKDWASYKTGFGDIEKDFWLGNDNIFSLTNQRLYTVRFDLEASDGEKRYALYDMFWIDDENNKYTLHIQDYSGNAGDSMIAQHNGFKFSTKDQDNDNHESHCSQTYKGGWWYNSCHHSNLNGLYLGGKHTSFADGIEWHSWRGYNDSMVKTEIKIRPKDFRATSMEETPMTR